MANFPSKLAFASFLQYAPRGKSDLSVLSCNVTYQVKQDGRVGNYRIIDFSGRRLAEETASRPFLKDYFNKSVTLIPVPRSSPLVRPDALWPPLRLCQSIMAQGLAANILPCVQRVHSVQKSATARSGQRPGPQAHYDSTEVAGRMLFTPEAITLVDDVITRGSSFVGLVPRVQETFPGIEIRCFALVRTISSGDIKNILDPIEGTISFNGVDLQRYP